MAKNEWKPYLNCSYAYNSVMTVIRQSLKLCWLRLYGNEGKAEPIAVLRSQLGQVCSMTIAPYDGVLGLARQNIFKSLPPHVLIFRAQTLYKEKQCSNFSGYDFLLPLAWSQTIFEA